jgi:repressor LexA
MSMSIAQNIRRLREQHGLTQQELGQIAGVSDKAVSTWENGTKTPRMGAVSRLAEHFGIPKSEILDDTASPLRDTRFAAALDKFCNAWEKTPEQIERELSLRGGRLSQLRRGEALPTERELDLFAGYFHAPRAVLRDSGTVSFDPSNVTPIPVALHDARRVPVLGRVPAGVPIEAITDIVEEIELSDRLSTDGYDYFGLLVTGDSMVPEYRDGDVVILRVQPTAETGDDVVAYIGNNDATLKRLTVTENGIQLRPLNPDYAIRSFTNTEVQALPVTIAGVVVEQRRMRRR